MNGSHLFLGWQLTEVNVISIRCRKGFLELIGTVGDCSSVGLLRNASDLISYVWLRDRFANEQQLAQYLVFLSQTNNILPDTLSLEIDGNQDIVLLILGKKFQDFFNGRHFLTSEFGIEPTASIKATDFF